jgi:pimeloyl-ACP methyl ester carboxylesterase
MQESELVTLDVKPGAAMENQSGLHMGRPRIYGRLTRPAGAKVAALLLHPTSNYMGHYLIEPLAKRGIATLALNTRYIGNDSLLLMEYVLLDVGAGVAYLRKLGFDKVLLIGNSGGASTMSFYQAQAEKLTIKDTPAGDPVSIEPQDLPPADAIALTASHIGRARVMLSAIDPSVIDENDPLASDPALDMYGSGNAPPYSPEFIERYREAQHARVKRISERAIKRLRYLRSMPEPIYDEAFIVHRTYADPRYLDLSLDPNKRVAGGIRSLSHKMSPKNVNNSTNSLGRFTTCTAWLSQWSFDHSRADGPRNLANTSVPILLLEHTADASVFPSHMAEWRKAGGSRLTSHDIPGGSHYLFGQPELIDMSVDIIGEWTRTA